METPQLTSAIEQQPIGGPMTDAQKLHFRASCQYIDKLLSSIEGILHIAESKSPFPKYKVDITLAQIRVLEDYIRRFRAELVRALAWQDIHPPEPEIPASRAISVHLNFIDITLADLRPSAMRGAGALPEATAAQLSGVVHELSSLAESMTNYVHRELNESLHDRIASLSESDAVLLLKTIEEIVTRNGLVEFRPRINMLLSRLEDHEFEIAVFGRVSSGKSSFLNAILHMPLLPVGVNPITAVPTRILFGDQLHAWVRYGDAVTSEVTLEEFQGLISERSNPGNERTVSRAWLTVPSPRLAKGVVFVDTPGLGSLARRGASETLAYLPSCDLALLLIVAAGTLTEEDIATLRLIKEAAIPAIVLLSKCDLLKKEDVDSTTQYVERQLSENLGQTIPVFPVSSIQAQHAALEMFFERELLPRMQQAESLKAASVQGKIERLRRDLITALETRVDQRENRAGAVSEAHRHEMEAQLRSVTGGLGELDGTLQHYADTLRSRTRFILTALADQLALRTDAGAPITSAELSSRLSEAVEAEVEPIIAYARRAASQAIEKTEKIGIELGHADVPEHRELDSIFREAPRFELGVVPANIKTGVWKYLGAGVVRSYLRKALLENLGPILDASLMSYAHALELWSRSLARALQQSVSSYLDAYRGTLQGNAAAHGEDSSQMRDDIHILRSYKSEHRKEGE